MPFLSILFSLAFVACDDDSGDSDSGNGGTAADDGGDGGSDSQMDDGADDGSMETSSEEVCMSSHDCINDVCTCSTPGKEDQACTDDDKCEDECEVCM